MLLLLLLQVASGVSNSVRPHRRQPTRLPRPWDSPGKNTGVGCHFLLQCVKVKSESEVAQSCPTPSNPMDCSPPGSSVHGNFQARVLEWGATAFSFANVSFVANLMGKKLYQLISTTLSPGFHISLNGATIFPVTQVLGREGNGTPLQYSCLANPMDRGAW